MKQHRTRKCQRETKGTFGRKNRSQSYGQDTEGMFHFGTHGQGRTLRTKGRFGRILSGNDHELNCPPNSCFPGDICKMGLYPGLGPEGQSANTQVSLQGHVVLVDRMPMFPSDTACNSFDGPCSKICCRRTFLKTLRSSCPACFGSKGTFRTASLLRCQLCSNPCCMRKHVRPGQLSLLLLCGY